MYHVLEVSVEIMSNQGYASGFASDVQHPPCPPGELSWSVMSIFQQVETGPPHSAATLRRCRLHTVANPRAGLCPPRHTCPTGSCGSRWSTGLWGLTPCTGRVCVYDCSTGSYSFILELFIIFTRMMVENAVYICTSLNLILSSTRVITSGS